MNASQFVYLIFFVLIGLGAILFLREVVCWYFKTSEIATYLKDIRDLLKNQGK